ncbi:MAG: hypothetical protein GY758_00465 [Fuerstiella sp.]|nr:hypothetical protein [Fuerstiella sp.]
MDRLPNERLGALPVEKFAAERPTDWCGSDISPDFVGGLVFSCASASMSPFV